MVRDTGMKDSDDIEKAPKILTPDICTLLNSRPKMRFLSHTLLGVV